MTPLLLSALLVLTLGSFLVSPKGREVDGFFRGFTPDGRAPGFLTLVLSQVTTWIFARSLLTAAILGYYYGIAGGLAYTAYYLSFFTGGAIIQSLRFTHGFGSVQDFLRDRFGTWGPGCYNVVIGVRLLSEVFANLLVIGMIFGESGSLTYILAIVVLSVIILAYSMLGGLRASLRSDVFQISLLAVTLAYLMAVLLTAQGWSWGAALVSSPFQLESGWSLLLVALVQIWSYPLHDPVMMDRGFLADKTTTRRSFLHAGWISMLVIFGFSLLGVFAGLKAGEGEAMLDVLQRLLGEPAMTALNLALIISAVSTLDSTFSSAAKLSVVDMALVPATIRNGRITMLVFLAGGLLFLFGGSQDLFSAVAVSGTASLYLAPVVFFCLWGGRRVATWAYVLSFVLALFGAALYYLEAGGQLALIEPLTGISHKYDKLLLISLVVVALGSLGFVAAMRKPIS